MRKFDIMVHIIEQIEDISRQCDIVLEQLRFEYIDPLDIMNKLKEFNSKLENIQCYIDPLIE